MSRTARWTRRNQELAERGLRRAVRTLTPTGPTTGVLDGREVIVACSNDYLGLAADPQVQAAARGGGATGSRLISGSRPAHRALEEALEDWLGRPALLFNSGYQANLAVLSTLPEAGDVVASDALNHASLIDGLRLSRATRRIVPHADPDAVGDADYLVLEGLYSMDGDVPPLTRYPEAPLRIVDEAHALGVLGPEGRGASAAAGLVPDVFVGTFGKAGGSAGAFVSGPAELIDLLTSRGRSFIFTTALPEPVAHMALAGLTRLRTADDRRERLAANVRRLRDGLAELGWQALGDHHIVPIVVGDGAMDLAARLLDGGVFAPGIRPPTVPAGQERLRLTVSSEHTEAQIDRILEVLGPC
ncbi:MAG: 8-amino-7-oxononanoate synthase [Deltaproteobacteria bacterium]|nr:MAG: 8-amino-7-oxononanoate synthase [Deltaproteobacteria bacterium]